MRATFAITRILFWAALGSALAANAAAQSADPAYLFLLEGKGVPTGTIHGFSINASTGALTEMSSSPFSAGLGPQQMVVDPTNRFLYVANQNSKDVTAFTIDPASGTLALLPGSPFSVGAEPVIMGIDPTGRFLYVFAATTINAVSQESLFEYSIDSSSGSLTLTASSPTTWEAVAGTLITSIAFNPIGNIAYLGQSASNGLRGAILICSVDFATGALTRMSEASPAALQSDHLDMSLAGNFLFSSSAPDQEIDAFAVGAGGALSEVSGSPYAIGSFPAAVLVHPSGNFLYVVNENEPYQGNSNLTASTGSISAFTVGAGTGALSVIPGSPFPAGINPPSIGIDPTGSFAYVAATQYEATEPVSAAQIQAYAIDQSSGALSALLAPAWTDLGQPAGTPSTATQLMIAAAAPATSNPTPAITLLSPSSIVAAGPAFTLQIDGTGFVAGSRAYFAGQPRATAFVSDTQLNVSVLAGDINNEGTVVVFVFNPLPGGGASTSVEFTVTSPLPVLTALSPSTVATQPGGFSLFMTGANFLTSSLVNLNGTPVATVYLNPTFIRGDLPSGALVAPGTATITVTNPPNGGVGGGTSNALTLTIVPPAPKFSVTGISPASAQAGGPSFTLIVNGTGFVAPSAGPPSSAGSQITFALASVPTTFVGSTQLTAAIPASAIAISGNPYVIVTNPNGAASTPITFTVNSPVPSGGSVTPPNLPAGSSALTLNVTGTGFAPSSIVLVDGSPRPTTYVSSTLLQATLLPSDISQGGTLNITVFTPPPGGGTSEAMNVSVLNPQPGSIFVSPPTAIVGTAVPTLTISGTGFVSDSQVNVNGSIRTANYQSSTTLQLALMAADVGQTGTLNLIVVNPPPGGGTSATASVHVQNPIPGPISVSPSTVVVGSSSSTIPITITGTGFVAGSTVLVNSSVRIPTAIGMTSITVALAATDISQGDPLDIAVSNPGPGGGISPVFHLAVEEDSLKPAVTSPPPVTAGNLAKVDLMFSSLNGMIANPVRFKVTAATPDAYGTMKTSFQPSATLAAGPSPLSVTLLVTTEAPTATSVIGFPRRLLPALPGIVLAILAMTLTAFSSPRANARAAPLAAQFLLLALLCAAAALTACAGAGAGSSTTSANPPNGTPPGPYTITVTATSGGVAHSATVTLQVVQ